MGEQVRIIFLIFPFLLSTDFSGIFSGIMCCQLPINVFVSVFCQSFFYQQCRQQSNLYDVGFILASASSGGIAGFLIGYAVKKGIKIIMTIAGMFLAGLAYLNYQGLISVDWDQVVSMSNNAVAEFSNSTTGYMSVVDSQVVPTMMNFGVPLTGSFAAGFVFGVMKG
jgi:uncharacterized membrane protein (Fun14 family)